MTPSVLQELGKVARDVSCDHVGKTKNVGPANLLNKDMNATEHARQRRKLLDMMSRLHTLGLAADIELPQIACIGSQSVGKSSLIESISGITLPRASGTCTRCPIECRLRGSTDRWSARVLLRFENGRDGYAGLTKEVEFGAVMMSRDHVPGRIRRAQLAILNPAIEHNVFLRSGEDTHYPTRSFSQNCVIVELSGKHLSDLNFVDLPGLIANVSDNKNIGDIQLVENLVASYISRPSCLILLAVSCENDYENQGAGRLASKYDPNGERTIGVLTKPDRIERGEESPWIAMITGQSNVLRHGWFSVKQPTPCELEAGISWENARAHDSEFFESTAPWSTIPGPSRHQLGCSNLIRHLGKTLVKHIVTRLPYICDEVDKLVYFNDKKLFELPDALSLDPLTEVMQLITSFTRDLEQQVRGDPGSGHTGLVQQLLSSAQTFQDELRGITPIFIPRKKQAGGPDLDAPSFLPKAEKWPKHSEETATFYLDDVVELAEGARTRELPGEFPFAVKEQLIVCAMESWNQPVSAAFERAGQIFFEHLTSLVDKHFAKHTYGGLRATVMRIVMEVLEERKTETQKELKFLLDMESLPFTLNSHYYMDYKEKFLRYYTANCEEQSQLTLSFHLEPSVPFWDSSVEQALRHLREAGFGGLAREDLIKLLPSDFSRQSALDIMASARAYYQVAYKRFSDTVPLTIDHHCVRAFNRVAQTTLIEGLRLGEPDARKRCEGWIAEPASVKRARAELSDKKIRLYEARRELREVPEVRNLMRKRMAKRETDIIKQKSEPETRPNPSATLMPTSEITGPGTSSPAYVATVMKESYIGSDTVTSHFQSISYMPTYSNFSVEELRVQDYTAGRKNPAWVQQACLDHQKAKAQ